MEENRNRHPLGIWQIESSTGPSEAPPPLISKKWLAIRFGLMQRSGYIYYKGLYTKVLTPEVIAAMNCTTEEIKDSRLRVFTRQQTLQLIEILGL